MTTAACIIALVLVAGLVGFVVTQAVRYIIAGSTDQRIWREYRISVAIEEFHVRKAHQH